MFLPRRDIIATSLVAASAVLYLLWLADAALPGMSSVRVTGAAVLALGFAASATAVVPGFEALLHGSRLYLALTSFLGLVALAGGVLMLLSASEAGLAVLMGTMVVLWAIATAHHTVLARAEAATTTRATERPHAGV
jgi:hypothetical protein